MQSKILDTKISLIVSLVSGVCFLGMLAFIPTEKGKKNFPAIPPIQLDENIPIRNFEKAIVLNKKKIEDKVYLETSPIKEIFPIEEIVHFESGLNNQSRSFQKGLDKQIQNYNFEHSTYYKDEKLSMSSIHDSRIVNKILEYNYSNKQMDQSIFQSRNQNLKNVELNYQLNSSFSANLRSSQFDSFDDRFKQNPTTMAGLNYRLGNLVSTSVLAGDSSFTNSTIKYSNQTYLNGNQFYKDMENINRDFDKQSKNLFEVGANLTPSKNVQLQTVIYNSNKSLINETNSSEGARFSFAYNLSYLMINLRYNFLSDNLTRTIVRPDLPTVNNRDFAGLGFTVFLDDQKRFSLYIGNNFHNIAVGKLNEANTGNVQSPNSFSASIRGKANQNTIFFLNFKNMYNRDLFFSNIGAFRVPVSSQLNQDFATSLGLEYNF